MRDVRSEKTHKLSNINFFGAPLVGSIPRWPDPQGLRRRKGNGRRMGGRKMKRTRWGGTRRSKSKNPAAVRGV